MRIIKVSGKIVGPLYHGSYNEFDEFDLSMGPNEGHTPVGDDGLIYLTGDKGYASQYGSVQEFHADLGKFEMGFMKSPEVLSKLRNGEIDSFIVVDYDWVSEELPPLSKMEEVVLIDPNRVRKL